MGVRALVALGMLPAFRDSHGNIVVDDRPVNIGNDYDLDGDGYDVDGDDDDWVSGDDDGEVGARMSREERQALKRRKKSMTPLERRQYRQKNRRDGDDDPDGLRGEKKKEKRMRRVPIGSSYTVSAAGAWSITITPPITGEILDLVIDAPSGTTVGNISTGLANAISGQTIATAMFAAGSFSRDVVKGLRVQAGVPLTISGSTTATSGSINASFVVSTHGDGFNC